MLLIACANVANLMLVRSLVLIAAGMAIGVLASLGLTRVLDSLLYGVSAGDPGTFAAIASLLAAVALAAAWIPARRAVEVDPVESLRVE